MIVDPFSCAVSASLGLIKVIFCFSKPKQGAILSPEDIACPSKPLSKTYTSHQPSCINQLAVINARTSKSSTRTTRALCVATYTSVACTNCPPGACRESEIWLILNSSSVRTSKIHSVRSFCSFRH